MTLQIRRLEKIIENRCVLSIEQLDIEPGMIVAVVGPVHSGKTLLIRMLSGLVMPGGGHVLLDGADIHTTPSVRRKISTMFEEDLLYERLSARKNLQFYSQLHHIPGRRVNEVLAQLGISDQADKSVSKLSANIQRRVAFARCLLGKPALWLLDQPVLRVDLDTQALFARLLVQAASEGAMVIVTDEDLAWAGKFCTHVVELEAGRIIHNYQPTTASTSPVEEADSPVEEATEQVPVEVVTPTPAVPERLIPFKIPGRKDERIMLYDPGDILYACSRDGKTFLRTATDEASTNMTLQELENRLSGRGFFKAHRAYLVNLQHIKAVIQYTRNSYTLQLDDKDETMIPLSKQSEKELQELLEY